MATLCTTHLIRSCVSLLKWDPWFSTYSDWMLDFSTSRAGTVAKACMLSSSLECLFQMHPSFSFTLIWLSFCGFCNTNKSLLYLLKGFICTCLCLGLNGKPISTSNVVLWCVHRAPTVCLWFVTVCVLVSHCSRGRGVVWLPYPLSPVLISVLLSLVLSWLQAVQGLSLQQCQTD